MSTRSGHIQKRKKKQGSKKKVEAKRTRAKRLKKKKPHGADMPIIEIAKHLERACMVS